MFNEVSTRTKACTELISNHQLTFEEGLQSLKQICEIHDRTEEEAKELREKVSGLSKRKQLLVCDLSKSLHYQDELKKLNQDLQLKSNKVIGHRTTTIME
ncbi:unnamed protein product [Lactuca saligna]|uniref:Uncharacterized protein n=1 Tax=Lactuca saligna TaxID=75948 RepID=A0AA36E7W9_LACSI|nr:unnamed protein product [Lactuca saligna]